MLSAEKTSKPAIGNVWKSNESRKSSELGLLRSGRRCALLTVLAPCRPARLARSQNPGAQTIPAKDKPLYSAATGLSSTSAATSALSLASSSAFLRGRRGRLGWSACSVCWASSWRTSAGVPSITGCGCWAMSAPATGAAGELCAQIQVHRLAATAQTDPPGKERYAVSAQAAE